MIFAEYYTNAAKKQKQKQKQKMIIMKKKKKKRRRKGFPHHFNLPLLRYRITKGVHLIFL